MKENNTAPNYRSEMIGLFGNPVDENPTVVLMEAAFKEKGLNYRYNTTLVKSEHLQTAVQALRAFNMKGTHITIPHKIEVCKYVDKLTDAAKLIGAVNTIYFEGDIMVGENTDGKGFIKALEDENIETSGKTAYILGAGGAAKAIAIELALVGVSKFYIANRTKEKGTQLVDTINKNTNAKAEFVLWDSELDIPSEVDFLINATSIGLFPDTNIPSINYDSIQEQTLVCDVIPNPIETELIKKVKKMGLKSISGFAMLVNQGAKSFELWTNVKAPIETMRDALAKVSDDTKN